jgi:hypothetical protein
MLLKFFCSVAGSLLGSSCLLSLFQSLLGIGTLLLAALSRGKVDNRVGIVENANTLNLFSLFDFNNGVEKLHINLDIGTDDLRALSVLLIIKPSFGEIIGFDNLLDVSVLEHLELLRAADTATEREDAALPRVIAGRRVRNA